MPIEIGQVEAIFRYPVKSMAGERLEVANLGWHGLDGDRRLAFRRMDDRSEFPWLSASKLPDLLRFAPYRHGYGERDRTTRGPKPGCATISPECCGSFTAIGPLPGGRVVGRGALIRRG